jgi:acetylglutamate kinase
MRVYKLGGPALEDPALLPPLAREISRAGEPAAVVHGGGRHVERMLRALGIESRFVDGRRETSPAAMEVVEMVLSGTMSKSIASGLTSHGVSAVGVSGRDAGMIRASVVPGLGRVGRPSHVDPSLLHALLAAGHVPVVSPVSAGPAGESLNVNADEVALAVARALGARTLVFLSDVDGVNVDGAPAGSLDAERIDALVKGGTIGAGMAMKVGAALDAARAGVPEVWVAGKARLLGGFPGTRIAATAAAEACA